MTASQPPSMLRQAGRYLAALLLIGIAVLALAVGSSANAIPASRKDFISYWAAGQLLIHHANPYDADAVFKLEKSEGAKFPVPLVMRNPPYVLVLALPLGFFPAHTALVIWSCCIIGFLMLSVHFLWSMHGRRTDSLHMLVYAFAPALVCLEMGQTSVFALLGLAIFLYFRPKSPFLAGLAVPLMFIKPHLLLPFALVLALWVWKNRAWRIPLGAAVSLAAAMSVLLYFDPRVWSHFLPVLGSASFEVRWIPTVSSLLRNFVFRDAAWSQYLLAVIACGWADWYFIRHKEDWNWTTHGSLLLMISVCAAPYYWFNDEVMLAPAMLQALYACADRRRFLWVLGILNGTAMALTFYGENPLASGIFIWTTTAWLVCYLYANKSALFENRIRAVDRVASSPESMSASERAV